jgi:hypothetical protein
MRRAGRAVGGSGGHARAIQAGLREPDAVGRLMAISQEYPDGLNILATMLPWTSPQPILNTEEKMHEPSWPGAVVAPRGQFLIEARLVCAAAQVSAWKLRRRGLGKALRSGGRGLGD